MEIKNLTSYITKLENAWSTRNPNRARGGQAAIAGFSYQIQVYLLKLVEQWLELSEAERNNPSLFITSFEKISDILSVQNNNLLVATQVKLTLRSSSLHKSLDEFLTIHSAARDCCPELLPKIRYQIHCSKNELADFKVAISNWQKKANNDNAALTNEIAKQISLSTATSPQIELLSLLVNRLKCSDPLIQVNEWIGKVISYSDSSDFIQKIGLEIWNALQKLWKNTETTALPFYLWQSNDKPCHELRPGSVLTGERPKVHHLKDGFFAPRPSVYARLEEELSTWLEQGHSENSDKLPIFWIGGRSGCGKSVAILHMLSSFFEKGHTPVIWVGEHVSFLNSAIQFSLKNEFPGRSPIIGLDDPYTSTSQENVTQHWKNTFASLHSTRQIGVSNQFPVIIACGPSEQAEFFRQDFSDEIKLHIHKLPDTTEDELPLLRDWFSKRTGEKPPEIEGNNTLMVQLFFEWSKHESINDFSKRLRDRLVQGDEGEVVLNKVSQILALNRLYVGYPPNALFNNLNLGQKEKFEWLEKDFHLGEDESGSKTGYWLLHAHLANSIYLNWYKDRNTYIREHLIIGIKESLAHFETPSDKVAPLWAISRTLTENPIDDVQERLDRDNASLILKEIFSDLTRNKDDDIDLFNLPVWVEIETYAPELTLSPSPINIAINAIEKMPIEQTGLRLTCHKLLQHHENLKESQKSYVATNIVKLLVHKKNWKEWFHVALDATKVLKDERLIALIMDYIEINTDNDRTTHLLITSLRTWPDNKALTKCAENYLAGTTCTLLTGDLAKHLIKHNEAIVEPVRTWIEKNVERECICFALSAALDKEYNSFEKIAIQWAHDWHFVTSANFILEPLLDRREEDDTLIDWCKTWIQEGVGDKSYVLEKLLKKKPYDTEIVAFAADWITNHGAYHKSWLGVWFALRTVTNIEEEYYDAGISWLGQNDLTQKTWLFIWLQINKRIPSNSRVFEFGKKWLKTVEINHKSWIYVWRKLLQIDQTDEQLFELCLKWLNSVSSNHSSWRRTWETLYQIQPDNGEVATLGIEWLKLVDLNCSGLEHIWNTLRKKHPDDPLLFSTGKQLLAKLDVTHTAWEHFWTALFNMKPQDEDLLNGGHNYLSDFNIKAGTWEKIWHALYKRDVKNIKLITIAKEWLRQADKNHGSWHAVWNILFQNDATDKQVISMGKQWLFDAKLKSGSWPDIWLKIIDHYPDNKKLYRLAYCWLKLEQFQHGFWPQIWMKTISKLPSDKELLKLGRTWLKNNNNKTHSEWSKVATNLMSS